MNIIESIIEKYRSDGIEEEKLNKINEAYEFAVEKHKGKKRKSGEDFVEHPLNVAKILSNINVDDITIIAALIHETISESNATLVEIEEKFGKDVANIVDNLTKINKLKLSDDSESGANYLKKVLVGLSEDVRVLIIKLADRLHNMRTLSSLPADKQKQKATETMNVLIPIAHRLGINSIKSELEDLCLKYSKPDVYESILEKLNGTREELEKNLNDMLESISDILSCHDIKFTIKGRVKSVYSIYTKLSTGRKWSDIYDILAMRAIVEKESDCYLAAGLIHSKYRPIPKRFKDYIAMPKANMYQSLHTSVFGRDGHIFEIQLRTKEMDEIAENGIASHWSYKEHTSGNIKNLMDQKLELYKNIIDSHATDESETFAKSMEEELLSDLIYVFTPKGDVMELPIGATPIDFAYRIHTNVGEKTVGAIVNEKIVQLDYKLQDGDIVKIKTDANSTPNKDWLNIVKTTQAKNKIKSYFSKQDRENYIELGKDLLEKEIRKQKLSIKDVLNNTNIEKLCKDLKVNNLEEIYLNIGSLRYTATYIINLIYEDKKNVQDVLLDKVLNNNRALTKTNNKNDIIVDGCDDILVNIAECCHPVKGDEIIGYITKGYGVSVHKKSCKNIKDIDTRLINVSWNLNTESTFISKIKVYTDGTNDNLLSIVTNASIKNVTISSINEFNNNTKGYNIVIKVKDKETLENFKESLRILPFVIRVELDN